MSLVIPGSLIWNRAGWAEVERQVVANWARPKAEAIAAACNEQSSASGEHDPATDDEERRGYRAGTQGDSNLLREGDYRATVITTTYAAMADDARNSRMINNLHIAEQ